MINTARVNPATYQALAIGMPIAAIALSIFIIYPTWGRFNALKGEVIENRTKLDALRAAPLPPRDPILTAAPDVESEPADFLRQITDLARESGCEINGLEVVAPGESQGVARPVRARVTASGHFGRVRALLWRLYRAPRLFAVADLGITADTTTTAVAPLDLGARPVTAVFTLERYVTPPAPTAPTTPAG